MEGFGVFAPQEKPLWVVCTQCLERCAPEDDDCHICGSPLEHIDEDDIFGIYGDQDDPLSVFEGGSPKETGIGIEESWCLRCDGPEEGCQCNFSDSLPFAEVKEDVWEAGVDAYDPSGMCDSCVFLFSSRCEPYRDWLLQWTEETSVDKPSGGLAPITGCENYRSTL